uniref:Uncharacterized protein n=1 Tax=Molossus molossus TaxID=27622 RepID=A0A7J8JVQ5_MOLMO|nr:hypothetical protein HJG59_007883 [Molossus molossus]
MCVLEKPSPGKRGASCSVLCCVSIVTCVRLQACMRRVHPWGLCSPLPGTWRPSVEFTAGSLALLNTVWCRCVLRISEENATHVVTFSFSVSVWISCSQSHLGFPGGHLDTPRNRGPSTFPIEDIIWLHLPVTSHLRLFSSTQSFIFIPHFESFQITLHFLF